MTDTAKAAFLKNGFVPLLKTIPADTKAAWGKMTLQHMVEHFTDAVRVGAGKISDIPVFTTDENLPKMQAFLMSDKPFAENIRNPLMPETPAPVRSASMTIALDKLQASIDSFFDTFQQNSLLITRNPFFGDLDFEKNVQLLYKHAQHHLRQFGVVLK